MKIFNLFNKNKPDAFGRIAYNITYTYYYLETKYKDDNRFPEYWDKVASAGLIEAYQHITKKQIDMARSWNPKRNGLLNKMGDQYRTNLLLIKRSKLNQVHCLSLNIKVPFLVAALNEFVSEYDKSLLLFIMNLQHELLRIHSTNNLDRFALEVTSKSKVRKTKYWMLRACNETKHREFNNKSLNDEIEAMLPNFPNVNKRIWDPDGIRIDAGWFTYYEQINDWSEIWCVSKLFHLFTEEAKEEFGESLVKKILSYDESDFEDSELEQIEDWFYNVVCVDCDALFDDVFLDEGYLLPNSEDALAPGGYYISSKKAMSNKELNIHFISYIEYKSVEFFDSFKEMESEFWGEE